jgi:hypothetical protein
MVDAQNESGVRAAAGGELHNMATTMLINCAPLLFCASTITHNLYICYQSNNQQIISN